MGMLGGLAAFGFLGVFLGPVLLALAYMLIEEWNAVEEPAGAGDAWRQHRPPSGRFLARISHARCGLRRFLRNRGTGRHQIPAGAGVSQNLNI
jgi:hypothetical protein